MNDLDEAARAVNEFAQAIHETFGAAGTGVKRHRVGGDIDGGSARAMCGELLRRFDDEVIELPPCSRCERSFAGPPPDWTNELVPIVGPMWCTAHSGLCEEDEGRCNMANLFDELTPRRIGGPLPCELTPIFYFGDVT